MYDESTYDKIDQNLKGFRKYITALRRYTYTNPARIYSYLAVIATYVVRKFPEIPAELLILTAMTIIGVGDQVQRIEDRKTLKAFYELPPDNFSKQTDL
jgi:hypothetical protein